MPDDFGKLCCSVADVVGTSLLPEAAIINYYPLNSTMGGHLDDAEHNLEKPIVSFSIGRSALFLIGGKTKLEDPQILFLTSGDAIVMSGESRLCYHGVPCILSVQAEQYLSGKDVGLEIYDEKWSNHEDYCHVVNYLRENRLNMNARQVRMNDSEEWVEKSGTGCVKV
jgi:alkylated DNA repair protein alkB family protein 1